jgi:glutamyl-tRNA reductase
MKKPQINPEDLEKDMSKLFSFLENLDNLDLEDDSQLEKLQEEADNFEKLIKTKYKDYLDDQE